MLHDSVPLAAVDDVHGKTVCRCSSGDHAVIPHISFPSAVFCAGDVQGSVECFWSANDHVRIPQSLEAGCAWSTVGGVYIAQSAIRLIQTGWACMVVIETSSL
ncbi:MAG: hypothetical protein BGN99_27110 [Alphaproteobacteria bacterium 65-37]|jgi:hypothetical protein|nr:MAG: hypothetical protein BGN99_27110 [Alphaproteobacteria bacterium 65-37]